MSYSHLQTTTGQPAAAGSSRFDRQQRREPTQRGQFLHIFTTSKAAADQTPLCGTLQWKCKHLPEAVITRQLKKGETTARIHDMCCQMLFKTFSKVSSVLVESAANQQIVCERNKCMPASCSSCFLCLWEVLYLSSWLLVLPLRPLRSKSFVQSRKRQKHTLFIYALLP